MGIPRLTLLVIGLAAVLGNPSGSDAPQETDAEFQKKLEAMLNLLCNIETKKYMMLQAEEVQQYADKPEWPEFLQKLVGRAMKACLTDLTDKQLFMRIATAGSEEERKTIRFPFLDRLKMAEIWAEESKSPDAEEKQLHELFLRIDQSMKAAQSQEQAAKDAGTGKTEPRPPGDYSQAEETEL